MRIYVAGSTGFVGAAVVARLSAHDLVLPTRRPVPGDPRYVRFGGGLAASVAAARPEVVINLLGAIREEPGAPFARVHAGYTRELVEGALACGVRKFIQMSALGAAPDAPSAYHRTKYEGEEAVRASGLPWVIFRPSYISGEGQKLRAELAALARLAPFFLAPSDAAAAPVAVEDVAACFARAAEDAAVRDEVFELAGERRMTFPEIFRAELAAAGRPRPVLGVPRAFFRPLLPLFGLLPRPPLTREQYLMLSSPNIPSGRFRGVKDLIP